MISQQEFDALVSTYKKHGWVLRRVVCGREPELNGFGDDVILATGEVDAAWFSRPPKSGPNPWEIRFLGPTQYALVEYLDEDSPDFEEKLHQIEERLRNAVAARQ